VADDVDVDESLVNDDILDDDISLVGRTLTVVTLVIDGDNDIDDDNTDDVVVIATTLGNDDTSDGSVAVALVVSMKGMTCSSTTI
jgi:hypothetical protein